MMMSDERGGETATALGIMNLLAVLPHAHVRGSGGVRFDATQYTVINNMPLS